MNRIPAALRWGVAVVALLLLGFLAWRVRAILGALAAGFLLAYAMEPLVRRLERWRVPRSVGVLLIAVALAAALAAAVTVAAPVIAAEATRVSGSLTLSRLTDADAWPSWLRQYVAEHRDEIEQYKLALGAWVRSNLGRIAASLGSLVARVTSSVAGLIVGLLNVVFVPVFAYYLVVDYERLVRAAAGVTPEWARPEVQRLATEVDRVLRAFVRGQLGVALAMGVLYAVGLKIVGTPLGVLIGVAAGLLNVVPYLGLAAGLLPALLLNFLAHQSWLRLLAVLVVFVIVQNIEGWILTPRLLGTAIGLHPVVVVLAVMIGGELFGFAGILLAAPVTAVGSVFWRELLRRWRASRVFREGPTAGGDARAR